VDCCDGAALEEALRDKVGEAEDGQAGAMTPGCDAQQDEGDIGKAPRCTYRQVFSIISGRSGPGGLALTAQ
jgi:hypothetical protein